MICTTTTLIRQRDAKNEPDDNYNRDPHAPAAWRGGDEIVCRYRQNRIVGAGSASRQFKVAKTDSATVGPHQIPDRQG